MELAIPNWLSRLGGKKGRGVKGENTVFSICIGAELKKGGAGKGRK